jgi:hypothetical protein
MMEPQQHLRTFHLLAAARPPSRPFAVPRFVVVTYLLGMLVLSVEMFLRLPENLNLVDLWNLAFLPVCWLYLLSIRQSVRFPYVFGMWFILLGSCIGTLFAFDPLASVILISKEVYLYVWFVTMAAVFASLEPSLVRRLLLVWTAVVVLHGVILVAEIVWPNFYGFMISVLGRVGGVDVRYTGRPSGLFLNPIWAALFQLMGFVPLLLVGLRPKLSFLLGMVLLLSILATASLGALSALLGASVVAVLLLLMGGHLKTFVPLAAVVIIAAALLYFTIGQYPDVLARLEHLTTERAAGTTETRLELSGRGSEALFSKTSILGLGPDNYRDSLLNKTLHNDFLEFGVERGVIGLLGLLLFGVGAITSAVKILLNQIRFRDVARPSGVIFLAMIAAILIMSQAHQIFHFRTVWLGLALQEATLFRMMSPSVEAAVTRPANSSL